MNEEHDTCALPLVRRAYALLGQHNSRVRVAPLPRGWHFILFTPDRTNGPPIYCGTSIQLCARAVHNGFDLWAEAERRNVCAEVAPRA